MLAIPLKQVSSVDVIKPLKTFLLEEYSKEDVAKYESALKAFAQLRQDVVSVQSPSSISRHVLLKYFGQLEVAQTRFPISETRVKLAFTWYDSFSPRKKITQYSLRYEQAGVMFNYASILSQSAVQEDRSTVEGLKSACNQFMQAAGAYGYIKDVICSSLLGPRTPDLTPEGLSLLQQLMLGQAQACFYEKAVKDKMKDATKAKLANQASDFYLTALEYSRSSTLAQVLDKSWSFHLEFQIYCMRSAAQYWQSKACKEVAEEKGSGYAEEITRLQSCIDLCQKGVSIAVQNNLPSGLAASIQQLHQLARQAHAAALKENQSIYMEMVPKLSDLTLIGKIAMVKPTVPKHEEIMHESGADLFEGLVPNAIRQRASKLKEDLKTHIKDTLDKIQSENDASRQHLSSLGLPSSLEAYESGLPDALWEKISKYQMVSAGITDIIDHQLIENEKKSSTMEKELHEMETCLGNEEVEDNICKQNYGTRWDRTPSSSLNKPFREGIDRYEKLLRQAKQSDKSVHMQLNQNENDLKILSKSRSYFTDLLPPREPSSSRVDTSLLSQLLLSLASLIQERDALQVKLNQQLDQFDPIKFLLEEVDDIPYEEILMKAKSTFTTSWIHSIEETSLQLKSLQDDISQQDSKFKADRKTDSVTLKREEIIRKLERTVDLYEELCSNVNEGKEFYSDLEGRIAQLKQTILDHNAARNLEKRELELNFAHDLNSNHQISSDAQLAHLLAQTSFESPQNTSTTNEQIQSDAAYAASFMTTSDTSSHSTSHSNEAANLFGGNTHSGSQSSNSAPHVASSSNPSTAPPSYDASVYSSYPGASSYSTSSGQPPSSYQQNHFNTTSSSTQGSAHSYSSNPFYHQAPAYNQQSYQQQQPYHPQQQQHNHYNVPQPYQSSSNSGTNSSSNNSQQNPSLYNYPPPFPNNPSMAPYPSNVYHGGSQQSSNPPSQQLPHQYGRRQP